MNISKSMRRTFLFGSLFFLTIQLSANEEVPGISSLVDSSIEANLIYSTRDCVGVLLKRPELQVAGSPLVDFYYETTLNELFELKNKFQSLPIDNNRLRNNSSLTS